MDLIWIFYFPHLNPPCPLPSLSLFNLVLFGTFDLGNFDFLSLLYSTSSHLLPLSTLL